MLQIQIRPQRVWSEEYQINYLPREKILKHPHFPQARDRFLGAVVDLYGKDVFLNKLLMEAARSVIFCVMMVLSSAYNQDVPSTWPTLANLKRLTAPFNQSSPRRIEQVVQRLIAVRFLSQEATPLDARLRFLVPTEIFIRHDHDWLAAYYAPLALLYNSPAYDLALGRSLEFQQAQREASMAYLPQSVQVLLTNPDVLLFATRDAGFLVLAHVVQDLQVGKHSTYAQIAQRFCVSRTHVRRLLEDAADLGLLHLSGRGGWVTGLSERGWTCLDHFIADGMSGHDLTGGLALRALGLDDPLRADG